MIQVTVRSVITGFCSLIIQKNKPFIDILVNDNH